MLTRARRGARTDRRVIARAWAEEFCGGTAAPPARLVDLHVADTAVAFFAGCQSPDAQALSRVLGSCEAAAASAVIRRTECDDIHVASCITPASVVVPIALATAIQGNAPLEQFDRAVAAGYAAGIRIGLSLGGAAAMGSGIWPTYFAAPIMAAATASVGMGLDADGFAGALGLAAAGAGGRAGRSPSAPSGRWLVFGEAVAKGLRAAQAAAAGFRGDASLISAEWLNALADAKHVRAESLNSAAASEIAATGLKPFVAARQTINAVVAFQRILAGGVSPGTITHVEVGVPTLNAAMVSCPASRGDRLSTISNMHVQIAAAALRPGYLFTTERDGEPGEDLLAFANRVTVVADPLLDTYLPGIWAGRVRVESNHVCVDETCISSPGDPDDGDRFRMVRAKVDGLVPTAYRQSCLELLRPADGAGRRARLAALWHVMRENIL
jgi:2-methylcitrate dehydratase PrpD